MKQVVGYAIAIGGLVIMALGFGAFTLEWAILNTIKPSMITTVGIIAIIVGVLIALRAEDSGKRKIKQATKEVPIYEGKGEHRKIVAYHREKA